VNAGRPRVVLLDDYEGALAGSPHLRRLADRVELVPVDRPLDPRELAEVLTGAPIVIAVRERTRFTAEVLGCMADVELLVQTGGHAYHIDVAAATGQDVLVTLGRRSKAPSPVVAELVMGLLVAWYRNLLPVTQAMRRGEWPASRGRLLGGRTLGVLGLGRHGVTVARLARAFGMRVVAWGPTLTAERAAAEDVEPMGMDDVLRESDAVTVHLRLAPGTTALIGRRELELMGPGTFLINTSRGRIVDEAALVEALTGGVIEGAALDVFAEEPLPPRHPFRSLDNVICTPHIGYTVDAAFDDFAETSAGQLEAYLSGRLDRAHVLNPEVGERSPGRWGGLADAQVLG
jgi:phosphoglycerate dehydrogenase-like enzyme